MKRFCRLLLALLAVLLVVSCASCSLLGLDFSSPSGGGTTEKQKPTYTITYDLGDGRQNTVTYRSSDPDYVPDDPTRDGYTFRYWTVDGKEGAFNGVVISGSASDIVFHAVWEAVPYSLTYQNVDNAGGFRKTYTVEDDAFVIPEPTREGYTFLYWVLDGGESRKDVTIPKGSTGNRTFRAVWSGTPFTFSASATVNAPITTSLGEEILRTGTPIRVTAPIYVGDSQFSHWEINGVKVASAPVYQFQMPAKNTALRAVYRDLVFLSVDKSQPVSALAVSDLLESAPDMFLGAGAKTGDYTLGDTGVTLSKDFLLSLDNGDHRFYIASTEGGVLKEDATFTVRVTGGTIAPAPDYSGLTDKGAEYYAKTFEYGGKTYHRVASTDEEFRVMLEYFVLVDGVLQMKASGNDKTKKISFDFWVCGDLNTRLINKDNILERAVASCSFPMHPSSIGLESYGNESGNAVTLSLTYVNGLNDTPSEEKAVTAKDRQKLLTSPGRAADYDSFAIDALTTTAEIRTVYELEVLPFGVKPTFDTSAADTGAKEVYEKARDILRLIIDDSMDDYAKVAAIYGWLGLNVTYDWTTFETDGQSASAYTVKGALIDRVAVCDGFASALRLLCQIEGIRAEEITGVNELGKEGTGHAWNKVWIGGAVFGVDSTWCRQNLKDGETVIPIVTLQYLFLDELGLLTSEHYENANPNNPYVVNLADAGFSMHNVVETDRLGHTFTVSDVIGFEALVKYLKDNGITAAEFYTTVDPSAFPGSASYTLFGAEEDDYCYILFE